MAESAPSVTPAELREPVIELEAHDHEQVALEVRHGPGSASTGGAHELELYLFIPRNVGLNATNYPNAEFYNDLTTYLRLDLAELTLEDLRTNARSPLRQIDHHLVQLARGEGTPAPIALAVKLFGHEFTEATRAERTKLRAALRARFATTSTSWRTDLLREVANFAATARSALSRLRTTKRKFSAYRRAAPRTWDVIQQTDEYTSLFLDGVLAELSREIDSHGELFDGSGWCARVLGVLASCAASEAAYRHEQGFVNFEPARPANREYFLYRKSLLKKAVQQALWVETKRRQSDQYVRNAAGMAAAGLAATWAVIAQLPQRLTMLSPTMQAAMIVLPVIAYVAKDRIKELTKEALVRRMRAFDQEMSLSSSLLAGSGLGSLEGALMENARFVDADAIPSDVIAARRRSRWIAGANVGGESVFHYRRRLEVVAPTSTERSPERDQLALRQIIRLSLRHFMTRLDEREQHVEHYEPTFGVFVTEQIMKVYHLNIVARLVRPGAPTHLQRWRVVFSKEGIERIEQPV